MWRVSSPLGPLRPIRAGMPHNPKWVLGAPLQRHCTAWRWGWQLAETTSAR